MPDAVVQVQSDSLVVNLSSNRTDALDVVGVGALNIDFLTTIATGTFEGVKQVGGVEWGTEAAVDESTLNDVLGILSADPVSASAGGSAFNALFALANMELGLKLGYVGVAGRSPVRGLTPVRDLEQLSVDVSGIAVASDALSGVCLSVTAEGERTLLTHAGANLLMPDYVEASFEALVSYLVRARIVHVTSFLDATSALWLGRLVAEVKKREPSVIVSFDPGHVWCRDKPEGFAELIRLSNFLFLNAREFAEMAGELPEDAEERARTILEMIDSPRAQILVKRPGGISCYRLDKTGVRTDYFGHDALPAHEVKDATGAGDVFAAGLLAVLAHSPLKTELGALLGMKLARHKLRFVGNFGQKDFASIRREFIGARDKERFGAVRPSGIFIAHGGDPQWLRVRDFISKEFESPVFSFESGVWGSSQISGVLDGYLDVCGLAVCVLTVEDLIGADGGFARQNVVHEIGLFEGKYGPGQVILLVEDGCRFVPMSTAYEPLPFASQRINEVLWSLAEQLRGRGLPARVRN